MRAEECKYTEERTNAKKEEKKKVTKRMVGRGEARGEGTKSGVNRKPSEARRTKTQRAAPLASTLTPPLHSCIATWQNTTTQTSPLPNLKTTFLKTVLYRMSPRLFAALRRHDPAAVALVDSLGNHTYAHLLASAHRVAQRIVRPSPSTGANASPPTIALLTQPKATFVSALLAAWSVPAAAVPLSTLYPAAALRPLLSDARPHVVLSDPPSTPLLPPHVNPVVLHDSLIAHANSDAERLYKARCDALQAAASTVAKDAALLIYTSGTTGRAKGVVWTHAMIAYQTTTMHAAWRWSERDRVLNVLPLHHIHGLINVVLTALYAGAQVEMHDHFDPSRVWKAFLRDDPTVPTVFMAVPAVYATLITAYEQSSDAEQRAMRHGARRVRLFVCGSASLSKFDYAKWEAITGQRILERYGMTEAGMILSNDYHDRQQGLLGAPLPGVEVRVDAEEGQSGRLLVRGPGVFREYWGRPRATDDAFVDGWMDTGDVVVKEEKGYRMVGRASTDIINTGGYKVSAVEIEDVVRECPGVDDCSVVGIPHHALEEYILAAVVSKKSEIARQVLEFTKDRLPRYKVPRRVEVVDDFPRNVLGKIQKKLLKKIFE